MHDDTIIETRDNLRARVEHDAWAHEPENDHGCPVLRIASGWGVAAVADTGYGTESAKGDGIGRGAAAALDHFIERHGLHEGVDAFDRYLRIFHGGSAVSYNLGHVREYGYVAYVTEHMVTKVWGNEAGTVVEPELDEYRAWCEGDTYYVVIEEREIDWRAATAFETVEYLAGRLSEDEDTFYVESQHGLIVGDGDTWAEVDSCYGFYGRGYAEQSAREELDCHAPKADAA